ncbi:MAG TPA: hypothetical protein VFX16_07840 [Pseudonocardiaceae bacterium]|nr:hypothetical protein [Pseudonocardiaceae bacterium]
MDSIVISRKQAATQFEQRIAVRTRDGENLVGTFTLPARLRNGTTIRLSKARLDERIIGDHEWPDDGVMIRIRMPNWRLRNGVVALFVLAGLIGENNQPPLYTGLLCLIWCIIGLCARRNRLHAVDRFAFATRRRFWVLFRNTLASTAIVYLGAIGAVIALYLTVAMVFTFVKGALTVAQLISTQRALSTVSEFYDTWIKLKEGPMFLVLVWVWLLTCLLLARQARGRRHTNAADEPPSVRYGVAQALNRTAAFYGRYSGPVAVTLTVLASFTFLTNVSSALGTRLRLQAVVSTGNYRFAAQQVEADLSSAVVSQLYAQIKSAMPADYQRAVANRDQLPDQVAVTQKQADQLVVPLAQSSPVDAQRLATEKSRAGDFQNVSDSSVIDASRGDDPVDVPHDLDLTVDHAAIARDRADSYFSDNQTEIISDEEVLLQTEKIASEPAWNRLKDLVGSRFPLAAPMVDALAEACDEHLQETLREKVPTLVKQFADKTADIRTSIGVVANHIVATVNVAKLVSKHTTEAEKLVARRQDSLTYLSGLEERLQLRSDLVEDIISGFIFDYNINRVLQLSDQSVQTGVVDDLRATMRSPGGMDQNAKIGRHNAAVAIHTLGSDGLSIVTQDDIDAALPICGCNGG